MPKTISSAMDGYTASVVGLVDNSAFGDFDRCALVTSTCRWCTIIGSTSEVSRISHSGEITCLSCALLPLPVVQPTDGVVSPDSSCSGSLRPAEATSARDGAAC